MKIGILTFWGVPNQGTYAQAYALYHYVKSVCVEDDVYQIGYLNNTHKLFYEKYREKVNNYDDRVKSDMLFLNEYNKIMHIDIETTEKLENEKFDLIILGSDIIWDYSIKVFGNDIYLFGNNLNAKRIISYAASFGTSSVNDTVPYFVSTGIKKLESVSVRDLNSAKVVEKITGCWPEILLDPVWLWDFENDNRVPKVIERDKYIFIYGEGFDDKFLLEVKRFAQNECIKVIALNAYNNEFDWCDTIIDSKEKTPLEVIGYFLGAEYVVTNTYHGVMFSLRFQKKMAYSKSEFVWAKIESLFDYLNIKDLLSGNASVKDMFGYNWLDSELLKKIEKLQLKSKRYIRNKLCKK